MSKRDTGPVMPDERFIPPGWREALIFFAVLALCIAYIAATS